MSQTTTPNLPVAIPAANRIEIPAKFLNADGSVNVEGMAKSYAELERTASAPKQTPPAKSKQPDDLDDAFDAATQPTGDLWSSARAELSNEGKISQETRDALKRTHRVTDDVINSMVAGEAAQKSLTNQRLIEAAGGTENLSKAIAHATSTRTPAQLAELRVSLKTTVGPMVLKGLMAEMGTQSANQTNVGSASDYNEPNSSTPANSIDPFQTQDELLATFKSPLYRTDPKFKENAIRRMAATQRATNAIVRKK